ncbi:MAG: glycosyltransferase family 4 protein, partial [Actinomycetota bacterium]|nr:glycosyltransferase family 4 protein [Actinomycetota bacterium]
MRILFVGLNYAPERTGIAPYTSGMAAGFAALGHQVRVITAFPHYPEWRFLDGGTERTQRSKLDGVDLLRVRHRLPKHGSSVSRVISELSFGVRALVAAWGRPDVVVLVSPAMFASALLALRARLRASRRLIVWVQDLYGPGVRETSAGDRFGLAERVIDGAERGLLRRAAGVVVIHDRMVDEIVASAGVDRRRVTVVRNWSHVSTASHTGRVRMRERLGWAQDETIVLHTGNMGAKQALGNVIEAARLADAQQAPVRFVLMGDGNTRSAIEAGAVGVERLQIVDAVPESQYLDALRAADVLLVNEHPALRTTALPSKMTSYFASGRPVVAATSADSLTASELISADAGLRVDPGDPAALLAIVQRLAADPALAARLGVHGRRYRLAHLTEHAAIAAFGRALREQHGVGA